MIELDGDEERISSQGRYAERDIVQVRPRLSECPLSRMSGGMLGLVINEGTMTPADPSLGVPTLVFFFSLLPLHLVPLQPFSHFILILSSLPISRKNVPPCLLSYSRLSYHTIHPHSLLFFIPFRSFYLSFFNSLTQPFVPCHRSFQILGNEFLHHFAILGPKYGIKKKECTGKGELCIHRSPVCRSAMLAFG